MSRFPDDPIVLSHWLKVCDLSDKDVIKTLRICSNHFVPNQIIGSLDFKKKLSLCLNAIPVITCVRRCVQFPNFLITLKNFIVKVTIFRILFQ